MWRVMALIVVVCASSSALAQVSADEAMKKLQEKQAARQAERSKVVTITQGELDDLKAEIAKLKAENQQLKASAGAASSMAGTAPAVKLVPKIAVGISKAELQRFVQVHKAQYEITGDVPGPGDPNRNTVTIAAKAKRKVYDGVGTNGVNRVSQYHEEMRADASLEVVLMNGTVSAVNETKLPLARDERDPLR